MPLNGGLLFLHFHTHQRVDQFQMLVERFHTVSLGVHDNFAAELGNRVPFTRFKKRARNFIKEIRPFLKSNQYDNGF